MYDLFNQPPTYNFFQTSTSEVKKKLEQVKEELKIYFDWWHKIAQGRPDTKYDKEKEEQMRLLVDERNILVEKYERQHAVENLNIKEQTMIYNMTKEELSGMIREKVNLINDKSEFEEIRKNNIWDLRARIYYTITLFGFTNTEGVAVFGDDTLEECRERAIEYHTNYFGCMLPIKEESN